MMDRRELLRYIAVLTGAAVAGGELFLTGCKTTDKSAPVFDEKTIALLDEVAETIIPATNTPGAKAARVGEFMKVMVTDCYTQKEQDAFMKGIKALEEACRKMYGKSFMDCTPQQRHDFLVSLEKEAKAFNEKVDEKEKPLREEYKKKGKWYEFEAEPRHYYTMMKQLTLLGFFTSKTGMTETLRHVPVPGKYDGCTPYSPGEKAWAE
ncbi:MAG: gluconate 2-dehydrogenase subunit 3 family protein [Chitinophagaceae bacterium]|nr:gluconate 2-dehydrogenase subunit 3 family protein [Chitinophagaceae bacterium]